MKSLATFLLFCIIISGCSIKHFNSGFETENGHKSESGTSFFSPPESSQDIARAELIASQARINNEIAKQIGNGSQSHISTHVIGVVINEDKYKDIIFRHPYKNETFRVLPESYIPIYCPEIPKTILMRRSDKKNYSEKKIVAKKIIYNGQKFDFAISAWSTN